MQSGGIATSTIDKKPPAPAGFIWSNEGLDIADKKLLFELPRFVACCSDELDAAVAAAEDMFAIVFVLSAIFFLFFSFTMLVPLEYALTLFWEKKDRREAGAGSFSRRLSPESKIGCAGSSSLMLWNELDNAEEELFAGKLEKEEEEEEEEEALIEVATATSCCAISARALEGGFMSEVEVRIW